MMRGRWAEGVPRGQGRMLSHRTRRNTLLLLVVASDSERTIVEGQSQHDRHGDDRHDPQRPVSTRAQPVRTLADNHCDPCGGSGGEGKRRGEVARGVASHASTGSPGDALIFHRCAHASQAEAEGDGDDDGDQQPWADKE